MKGIALRWLALLAVLLLCAGCGTGDRSERGTTVLVFKHGKIAGDPEPFRQLLARFEREHPGIRVKDETLPASTDEQHQFYVINLEGKSADFDVLSMDVIWVPEFARAGWLRDLTRLFPDTEQEAFFPGPVQAVTHQGRTFAIPWYIDAGILYYRRDLLEEHGFPPPRTWHELIAAAQTITTKDPGLYGYLWQGKQYEGLVCNVLEFIWGNGGEVLQNGKVVIDSLENRAALQFMRDLLVKHRITPALVTTAIEETTRHLFGSGKAVFMRNWPYAWTIFEREGSPIKGKVGVMPLPAFSAHPGASTLGGWQLGINRYSRHPEAAEKLVRFFTSAEAQKALALTVGYKPTRKALYRDRDLLRQQPFMAQLYEVFLKARPRPVTPYYMMMSQAMQPEFSAVLSGIKTPEEALRSAQRQIAHILEEER